MQAIHQFLAGYSGADAISNEARILQKIFGSWGYRSDIFSETRRILPELRKFARDAAEFKAECSPSDIALLHLSIGSDVNDIFAGLPCRKAILYHNITPSSFFDMVNKRTALNLARGRAQLKALAGTAAVNMADSSFNALEMKESGYSDVSVMPLVLDLDTMAVPPNRQIIRRFSDGTVNVLFVGRCAPNKRIEDCLTAFYHFHQYVNPNSRFIHVGSFAGTERYYDILMLHARELDLCESVYFARSVDQAQLNAFYKCANLFLCMSEHEGFCVPLLESMAHSVPVLAYASAAVPETADGAGVLFHGKEYDAIAEMMGRLTSDTPLRSAVLEGQAARLARYRSRDLEGELKLLMAPLST